MTKYMLSSDSNKYLRFMNTAVPLSDSPRSIVWVSGPLGDILDSWRDDVRFRRVSLMFRSSCSW
ncbi:hypothetical protein C8T65DRAFT_643880 [Cerioporus squamosus]|nr:hypothetical protein C8T65DRAFT_643880 [Cerioporus squamosus]